MKRAGEIGPQLLAALGLREHGKGPGPTEAADKRARAFSLLVHAYDQTRRVVSYLRWNKGERVGKSSRIAARGSVARQSERVGPRAS
ncbi:hypothetical protein WME91_54245 [Sorangium sp. So ce269]